MCLFAVASNPKSIRLRQGREKVVKNKYTMSVWLLLLFKLDESTMKVVTLYSEEGQSLIMP